MRLRLWPARPNQALTKLKLKPGPVRPLPPRPPTARELIDVLGVGVSQTVGGITLTLLSLERYAEVSVVHLRLLRPRPRGWEFLMPDLRWSITDGSASDYAWAPMSSGGGGGEDVIEYRMSYALWPTPSAATEIALDVPEIAWKRLRPGQPEREIATTTVGPWHFVVQLRAATS